ncbi:MAG: CHC2 zinc finger domain-containing protein [Bacteroidaceae bacterium]|nr:CHC2 zinc finger domain-containing protein [Bacteroidaceae bacterium]
MLSRFDIQKLQDLPIEQVSEALQISVSRHKALCPFHEDTRPSLTFNVRKNRYRCFVCDASGNSIDLVMKSQGWSFYESCKWLAKQFSVVLSNELGYFQERALKQQVRKVKKELPPPPIDVHYLESLMANPVLTEEAQRFLFDERKISPQVVRQIGISSISQPVPMSGNLNGSWFNAPSLLIPYKDIDGNLLSVQARYLGNSLLSVVRSPLSPEGQVPRFQFPKGSICSIFNLPVLKTLSGEEELWITEGVTDCLAMLSSGRKAIAIPSATLLKPEDVELITRPLSEGWRGSFHMYPDQDEPGERLFLELNKLLSPHIGVVGGGLQHHLLPSKYKDFGEYWAKGRLGILD